MQIEPSLRTIYSCGFYHFQFDAMQPGAVPNLVSDFHTFNETTQTSLNEELGEAFSGVSKGKE